MTYELIKALDDAEEEEIPTEEIEATIELLKAPYPKPKRRSRVSRAAASEKPDQARKRTRSSKSQ